MRGSRQAATGLRPCRLTHLIRQLPSGLPRRERQLTGCSPHAKDILIASARARTEPRAGFSLLEVIVAIAILFGGAIALSQLASVGRQHSVRATRITAAQTLCQNKLNELVAGIIPLAPVVDAPFHESPDWTYSINIEPLGNGLASVKVSVYEKTENELMDSADAIRTMTFPSKPRYSLVRWLRPLHNDHAKSLDESTLPNDDNMARLTP